MFDAVIRPACRTKPLPAAGDLPFGAVACGIPSCGSPPTSGHSLRHCCAGRYTAAPRRGAGRRCSSTSRQPSRRRRESCCSSTWQSILSLSVICLPPHMPTVWIPSPVRMMSDNRHSPDSQARGRHGQSRRAGLRPTWGRSVPPPGHAPPRHRRYRRTVPACRYPES